MESYTVLESYDLKFCCVCTQNSSSLYLNVFDNVISFHSKYISLQEIIKETMNIQQNFSQLHDICVDCKTRIVEFFVFKRRTEEARQIFANSPSALPPVQNILLQVVDHIATHKEETLHEELESEMKEEFLDENDVVSEDDVMHDEPPHDEVFEQDQFEVISESPAPQSPPQLPDLESRSSVESIDCPSTVVEPKSKINRRSNPESWLRNQRKLARNTGRSYIASNGRLVEAKQMRNSCGKSCRMQCSSKITEEERLKNFNNFYALADIAKQRRFLFLHMKSFIPKRSKTLKNPQKTRACQRNYFLDLSEASDGSDMVQVCKLMFLNSFTISSQMIDTLFKIAIKEGRFSDVRGKFKRKHSKSQDFCVTFIDQLPADENENPEFHYPDYVDECNKSRVEALSENSFLEYFEKQRLGSEVAHEKPSDQRKGKHRSKI